MPLLSVVVPAYNEQDILEKTAAVISQTLSAADIRYEILFVNDGSRDGTWEKIQQAAKLNPCVRGISFSRNFGKESAILAGLSEAKGDCCAVIDCDLQQPPAAMVEMYRLWEQGYKVVNGVKSSRGKESALHRFAAKAFYAAMSAIVKIDMSKASDYKLLDREVVEVLLGMPERNYFFRALSEYAVTNITAFSSIPLNLITVLGGIVFLVAVVFGLIALIQYFSGSAVEGFTTVILLLLLIGSIIMVSLGIIGFYVSKIYEEIKQRPKFLIAARTNSDTKTKE